MFILLIYSSLTSVHHLPADAWGAEKAKVNKTCLLDLKELCPVGDTQLLWSFLLSIHLDWAI